MAAAVAAAMPWWSPGKGDGQVTGRLVHSPTSVLDLDAVEAEEQTNLSPSSKVWNSDDADWDPEIATESSLAEISGSVVLGILTTAIEFETADSDVLVPWGDWNDDVDVAVHLASDPAQSRGMQIGEILTASDSKPVRDSQFENNLAFDEEDDQDEEDDDRNKTTIEHTTGRARDLNGKIKEWRYAKRGDGTRRHGRPPDLTLGRPLGLSESWNMGVYPGRGPALISRADMIILPPTTPSAITFKDSTTLLVGVSGHSAAEDTVTGTFLSALAVNSTPGPATSTSTRDEPSKPPSPHAPKLF